MGLAIPSWKECLWVDHSTKKHSSHQVWWSLRAYLTIRSKFRKDFFANCLKPHNYVIPYQSSILQRIQREWKRIKNALVTMPQNRDAVMTTDFFANFFVDKCRQSKHKVRPSKKYFPWALLTFSIAQKIKNPTDVALSLNSLLAGRASSVGFTGSFNFFALL